MGGDVLHNGTFKVSGRDLCFTVPCVDQRGQPLPSVQYQSSPQLRQALANAPREHVVSRQMVIPAGCRADSVPTEVNVRPLVHDVPLLVAPVDFHQPDTNMHVDMNTLPGFPGHPNPEFRELDVGDHGHLSKYAASHMQLNEAFEKISRFDPSVIVADLHAIKTEDTNVTTAKEREYLYADIQRLLDLYRDELSFVSDTTPPLPEGMYVWGPEKTA